jgi:hypothetical protein
MTVYVDDVRHRLGRMVFCHMWSDSLDELFSMVDKIGVQRKWIQGHPTLSIGSAKQASWLHFDVSLGKKADAIAAGAVLTDKYGPLEFLAKRAIASGDPTRVAAGEAKLEQIAKCRAIGKASE